MNVDPNCFTVQWSLFETAQFNLTCDPNLPECVASDASCNPLVGDKECNWNVLCDYDSSDCTVSEIQRYSFWCPDTRQFNQFWLNSCLLDHPIC